MFSGESLKISAASVTVTPPNGPEFSELLRRTRPALVMFDRLSTEEMFGWQVREVCPDAARVLDTQDLHFLVRVLLNGQFLCTDTLLVVMVMIMLSRY